MSDKSYVTLEQQVCLVCGQPFDTGSLLLDRRLRKTFEHHTVTGWGLCSEHDRLFKEGYVALVGCDPTKSRHGNTAKPDEVYRTGEIAHIRRAVFSRVFNTPTPDGPIAFVEPEVIEHLKKLMADAGDPAASA